MKNLDMIVLFDFYRNVLTEKQAEAIDLYYNEDLSLAEISENMGITRQGVRDNIKRGENVMLELEESLGLVKRYGNVKKTVKNIISEIEEIESTPSLGHMLPIREKLIEIKSMLSEIEE